MGEAFFVIAKYHTFYEFLNFQVKELLGELRGLHQMDRVKLIAEQEAESHQFVAKLEQDFVAFLERQRLEQTHFFNKVSQQ